MKFILCTTLQPEFVHSSWVRDETCCSLPDQLTEQDAHPEEQRPDLLSTISSFCAWTLALKKTSHDVTASDTGFGQACPACPHKQLLLLAEGMQHSSSADAGDITQTVDSRTHLFKAVVEPLQGLAEATEFHLQGALAARISLHQQQHTSTDQNLRESAASDLVQANTYTNITQSPGKQPSADVEAGAQQQEVAGTPETASPAACVDEEQLKMMLFWLCHLTISTHQFATQQLPTTPAASSKGRKSGHMSLHQYQQLQQKWLQKTLPALLQHLVACYYAVTAQHQLAVKPVYALSRPKDRTAADKLLLATCFSIMSTSAAAAKNTSGKSATSGSKRSSCNTALQLPPTCLQLCASMLGCHLLFKFQQQQRSSEQQPCSQLVAELCRILQDSQQCNSQHREVLTQAFAGLLTDARSAQQGMQLLCHIAEAVFPAAVASVERPRKHPAGSKLQKQQQGGSAAAGIEQAAAAAAANPSTVLLLELLVDVLQQVSAASSRISPTEVWIFSHQARVLTAAMLPKLLPASMHSTPYARKLWLELAGIAAAAAVPATGSKAAGDLAGSAQVVAVAAAQAHSAGVSVLAAAAASDRDANVRSKAVGLLQDTVPCMWQQVAYWQMQAQQMQAQHTAKQPALQQQQQLEGLPQQAADQSISSSNSDKGNEVLAMLQGSLDAVTSAVKSQLIGSSKSCRIRALQLLQELLCSASEVAAAVLPRPATVAAGKAVTHIMKQQQQQLVVETYPCIAAMLNAPQDSVMHCPASKEAAGLLLAQMAAVLQPQQALQLVLSCKDRGSAGGSSSAAGKLLEGLSQCSEQALYHVLKQQILLQPGSSSAAAGPGAVDLTVQETAMTASSLQEQHRQRELLLLKLQRLLSGGECCSEHLRQHAFLQVVQMHAAAVAATDIDSSDASPSGPSTASVGQPKQQLIHSQQDLMLAVQLLELSGGCSTHSGNLKDLRGEIAILTDTLDLCCYWMQQIQDAAAAAAAAQTAQAACPATAAGVVSACVTQILANVIQSAAVGAAGDDETHQQQQLLEQPQRQHRQAVSQSEAAAAQLLVCEQLLSSILRILVQAAKHCSSSGGSGSAGVNPADTQASTPPNVSIQQQQKLWGSTAASLMYHLDSIVSCTAWFIPAAAVATAGADVPVQQQAAPALQIKTLGLYIQALCAANSSNQMALHELLLSWHKELLQSPCSRLDGASAVQTAAPAAARRHAKLIAFLLLMQHLAGFYQVEQQRFKQRLMASLQDLDAADPAAAAAAGGSQPEGISQPLQQPTPLDSPQQPRKRGKAGITAKSGERFDPNISQQKSRVSDGTDDSNSFNYLMGEEARQCVEASTAKFMAGLMSETAPACYVPLLVQLLQAAGTPQHIKVLALQALQPLLLCCSNLASQHSMLLSALLADPSTPPTLRLQAVTTAGAIIAAAPAQNQLLVQKLEQLLLQGLAAAAAAGDCSDGGVEVLSAAAGVYAVLLLHEKLLLAAASWSVIAAGLLAAKTVQAVSLTMQQLLHCLLTQQRLPRTKAALGLLMNCPAAAPSSSSSSSSAAPGSKPIQLVQQHLLGFLTPKDLASEELQLPLLSALGQAAAAGGWAAGGLAEPIAILLAACYPTGRCLDTLLGIVQSNKSAVSQPCSAETISHLQTYAARYKAAAASRSRKAAAARRESDADPDEAAAAAAGDAAAGAGAQGTAAGAAAQAKLQALLSEAAAAGVVSSRRGPGMKRKAPAAAKYITKLKHAAATAARPDASTATTMQTTGRFRTTAIEYHIAGCTVESVTDTVVADDTKQEHLLVQQLLAQRQQALQQYRARKSGPS